MTVEQTSPPEELAETECLRLLATQDVGRLAFVDGDQPMVVPVNYALDGATIVFRTGTGAKLANAPLNRVAFEVDQIRAATKEGWSVVVKGVAQDISTAIDSVSERLRSLPVSPWIDQREADHWIRIVPRQITGRRVHPAR
jgi:nitroimidazol reductase NimA-like FMN-containing flavoprotein (pyridoxamine 5'-phosphate oxidase superfamily)